jgi:IS1 family transposase
MHETVISNSNSTTRCHQTFWQVVRDYVLPTKQRVSRLVRKTLSFSKSVENHIGAIWYFVHHYNSSLHL